MLKNNMSEVFSMAKKYGWVMEPQAKKLLQLAGLDVLRFLFTPDPDEAIRFVGEIKYSVVAKVVSPDVIHKSDVSGVALGIGNEKELREIFSRMNKIIGFQGILVEEQFKGIEMIMGMKLDQQFGPVVLLGMGGTGVEIYKDISLRMAPLREKDAESMIASLVAQPLLKGYRGADGVNADELKKTLMAFSNFVMEFGNDVESVDINPLICNASRCVVADARIILSKQ